MSLRCTNSLLFSKLNIYRNLSKIFQNTLKTKFVEIFKRIFFSSECHLCYTEEKENKILCRLWISSKVRQNLNFWVTQINVFIRYTYSARKKWYNIDSSSYWYVVDWITISMHWLVQYLIELSPFWRFPCNLWKSFRFWMNWFFWCSFDRTTVPAHNEIADYRVTLLLWPFQKQIVFFSLKNDEWLQISQRNSSIQRNSTCSVLQENMEIANFVWNCIS